MVPEAGYLVVLLKTGTPIGPKSKNMEVYLKVFLLLYSKLRSVEDNKGKRRRNCSISTLAPDCKECIEQTFTHFTVSQLDWPIPFYG